MDKQVSLFRQLVLWIWDTHGKPGEYVQDEARTIFQKTIGRYTSISRMEELENLLPSEKRKETDFLQEKKFLYLKPVTKERLLIPVLSIRCNFNRSLPDVALKLALFLLDNKELKVLAYRFETPTGIGIHNHYHVQIIKGFERSQTLKGTPEWLPTKQPSFPLDAKSPVQLVLCLLVSLYGRSDIRPLLIDRGGVFKSHLREMMMGDLKSSTFWKVTVSGKEKYYC